MLETLVNTKKERIGKPEICATIAEKTGISLKDVTRAFDAYHQTIMEAVSKNHTVLIRGFGTYSTIYSREHFAVNPQTTEEIVVPERVLPKIRFGTVFKRVIKDAFDKRMENTDAK